MPERFVSFDLDNDGVITKEEIELERSIRELDSSEKKETQQRKMAWISIWSMIIFTLFLFSPFISTSKIDSLSEIISMFYIAQAGIVAAFFGASAWMSKTSSGSSNRERY